MNEKPLKYFNRIDIRHHFVQVERTSRQTSEQAAESNQRVVSMLFWIATMQLHRHHTSCNVTVNVHNVINVESTFLLNKYQVAVVNGMVQSSRLQVGIEPHHSKLFSECRSIQEDFQIKLLSIRANAFGKINTLNWWKFFEHVGLKQMILDLPGIRLSFERRARSK